MACCLLLMDMMHDLEAVCSPFLIKANDSWSVRQRPLNATQAQMSWQGPTDSFVNLFHLCYYPSLTITALHLRHSLVLVPFSGWLDPTGLLNVRFDEQKV